MALNRAGSSSARNMANRLAAASIRSPRGLRFRSRPRLGRSRAKLRRSGASRHSSRSGNRRCIVAEQVGPAISAPGDRRPPTVTGPITALISFAVTRAGAQDRRRAGQIEHGRFDADAAGAAVEDQIDLVAERRGHVGGRGRADPTGRVGARRGQRLLAPRSAARAPPDDRRSARATVSGPPRDQIRNRRYRRAARITRVSGPGQKALRERVETRVGHCDIAAPSGHRPRARSAD